MAKTNIQAAEELQELLRQSVLVGDQSSINTYQNMLHALEGRLKNEEWKGDLSAMSTTIKRNQIEKKQAVDVKLSSSEAYMHASDEKVPCPTCFSNSNIVPLGEMTVDGNPRPLLHCKNCNKVFSDLPSGVKILMDEAVRQGAEGVGFTAANGSVPVNYLAQPDTFPQQQANQKLDQVNSNLSMMSGNISTLSYTMQNLVEEVRRLAEQNNKMMTQLANDPLISVRKAVSEFNLK